MNREVLTAHFKTEIDAIYIEKYAVDQFPWMIYDDWVILASEKIPQLLTALEMGLFEPPLPFHIYRTRFSACHAILVEHNICVNEYLAIGDIPKVQQFLASKKRARVGVIATMHALRVLVGRDVAKIIVRVVWM